MNRKVLTAYYIISIAFLLVLLGLAAYQLRARLQRNLEASQRSLEALRIAALSTSLAEGGFDSEYFRSSMKDSFRRTPRLLLLAIYSEQGGVQYLFTANRELLGTAPPSASTMPVPPAYELRPLLHLRLSAPFSPGIRSAMVIEGVFLRADREDLLPILRESFYVLLVYLAVTSLLLLVAALTRPERAARRSGSKAADVRPVPPRLAHSGPAGEPLDRPLPLDGAPKPGTNNPGLYSPETGLGWRDYLPQRLSQELERAASFDQDLALLLVAATATAAAVQGSSPSAEPGHYLYRQLSAYVLESFPLRDLDFEYDARTVAVILPDRGLDQGLEEAKSFQRKLLQSRWPGPGRVRVAVGLSSRSGRLISGTRLLIEAGRSLKKAHASRGDQIVAFRADPQKFRQVLFSGRSE
jgi:GGDEF domain-containing protein